MPRIISSQTKIQALEREVNRLKKMNRAKTMVLSILSHNAIPPLMYMKKITNFTLDNWGTLKEDDLKDCANLMKESSESLYDLSKSILNWTRQQSGFKVKARKDVYFTDVVEEERKLFFPLLEEKDLCIINKVNPSHKVLGEVAVIRLILQNLLSNAIKFSIVGGNVFISTEETEKGVEMTVKDEGIGMNPNQIKSINSLTGIKVSKGTNNEQGHGLGFLIIDDFLAQLGGHISITSKVGVGTEVKLFFPK